jgi:hypothetical protein
MDTTGNIARVLHLNHVNDGWEDLTLDGNGVLYVGAFGNNKNDRRNLSVLRIPHPEKINDPIYNAELIRFTYSDQRNFPPRESQRNFDCDAFVSFRDSLFIFTKNRTQPFTGYTKVYRLPASAGEYEAVLYDSIFLGNGAMMDHWVTSADVSPDGQWLALLSHDCIWLMTGFGNDRFSSGRIWRINLGTFTHKAGLCFASDKLIYIVDELELGFLGGKLYSLDFAAITELISGANAKAVRNTK